MHQVEQGPSVFRSGKIFFQSTISGDVSGWYISMKGGNIYGPFREKDVARDIFTELARRQIIRQQARSTQAAIHS